MMLTPPVPCPRPAFPRIVFRGGDPWDAFVHCSFGGYIPCEVLWGPVRMGGDTIEAVAHWYQIAVDEVEEAVRYWSCWLTRPVGWPIAQTNTRKEAVNV